MLQVAVCPGCLALSVQLSTPATKGKGPRRRGEGVKFSVVGWLRSRRPRPNGPSGRKVAKVVLYTRCPVRPSGPVVKCCRPSLSETEPTRLARWAPAGRHPLGRWACWVTGTGRNLEGGEHAALFALHLRHALLTPPFSESPRPPTQFFPNLGAATIRADMASTDRKITQPRCNHMQ